MKDICLNCGLELKSEVWGAKCNCDAPNVVHQEKCDGCGRIIGVIIDDDYCGLTTLYCPDCIDKLKNQI